MVSMDFFVGEIMKLAVSIYNLSQLNKRISYIDCAILNTKEYSLIYEESIDLQKAISICNRSNVTPIIAMNRMVHPNEIAYFESELKKFIDSNVLFLITDIGLANIAKRLNIINRVIFDPQTMITNKCDLALYSSFNFDALSMSLEFPLKDVIESINEVNASLIYQIFGHRLMFYSKRSLISLYEEKANIKTSKNHLLLRESTRDDFIPVIENENGTMMFRSYIISLLKHKNEIDLLKYGYLESTYIDDSIFLKALKIYSAINKNEMELSEALKKLEELNLNINDGFTYKDSVYQKEEF